MTAPQPRCPSCNHFVSREPTEAGLEDVDDDRGRRHIERAFYSVCKGCRTVVRVA